MRVLDRICVDSLPRDSPFEVAVGSLAIRVAYALYARQTQTGGTQTHALFNTDFRESPGKSRGRCWVGDIPWGADSMGAGGRRFGSVRVGSDVLKVREAFWDRLDGSIRALTPRLESSDSREADILSSDLVSWTPARRCHLLHGDVFRNWCQSPTRNEFPLARRREHYSDEPPSGGSIR